MIKIYALVSGELILYVGQTKHELSVREYFHRTKSNPCFSKFIPSCIDWTIKLLEEVPDDQKIIKEQYYYDTLKPLYNGCRPGNTSDYEKSDRRMQLKREASRRCYYKKKKLLSD